MPSIKHLMKHVASLWRMNLVQETAQIIEDYTLVARVVPCFFQPADSKEAFWWSQRGIENVITVYTSDVCTEFRRNDVLLMCGKQYHIVGVKNGDMLNVYQELSVVEYPEDAKKRLDMGEYPAT